MKSNDQLIDHAIHCIEQECDACIVYAFTRTDTGYSMIKFGSGDHDKLKMLAICAHGELNPKKEDK